jgi:hypothetical protein
VLAGLRDQRGRQFDPALVDAFLALVPSLGPELVAPGLPAPAELGVVPAIPAPRRPDAEGSAPAAVAGTTSSRPAAPSRPA